MEPYSLKTGGKLWFAAIDFLTSSGHIKTPKMDEKLQCRYIPGKKMLATPPFNTPQQQIAVY